MRSEMKMEKEGMSEGGEEGHFINTKSEAR